MKFNIDRYSSPGKVGKNLIYKTNQNKILVFGVIQIPVRILSLFNGDE